MEEIRPAAAPIPFEFTVAIAFYGFLKTSESRR
jgi:hypothetical protein